MSSRWANMPTDLLKAVAKKMTEPADYIRFRSVCHSWRSSTSRFALPLHIPLLMLPYDPTTDVRPVHCLSSNQVRILFLPGMVNKIVLASGRGWLVLLDITTPNGSLSLLNPLTGDEIQLPPTADFFHQPGYQFSRYNKKFVSVGHGKHGTKGLNEYADIYPWRAFLSSRLIPINGHGIVMMSNCYSNNKDVAFCKVGDFSWTVLRTNLTQTIVSMACHKDRFFMMDAGGNISVCKIAGPLESRLIHSLRVEPRGALSFVTASKRLFVLVSYHEGADNSRNRKGCFRMFKLRLKTPPGPSRVESARGHALFRCEAINQSLAVRTKRDIPGYRPECVYFGAPFDFPDERLDGAAHEIDVLNLRTGNWEYLSSGWMRPLSGKLLPSIWVQLSLC